MKKIFSAFLLMTMMVFSVGSFVSCSDLENEIAKVDTQANANAAAIESLNSEIAALKTALSAAQADADAAMTAAKAAKEAGDAAKAEAEAAKAAAAQAKAEALAAVAEELEAIQTAIAVNVEAITNLGGSVNANAVEIEALQEEVKALQTAAAEAVYAITNLNGSVEKHENAIADLETEVAVLKATIAKYEENLKELGLFDEEMKKQIEGITYAITNLDKAVETNTNEIDALKEQLEDVVAQVETLNASLVAIYDILGVLANQIQSVVFVPEYRDDNNAVSAIALGVNKDGEVKLTNIVSKLTYEVRPAKLASSITSENVCFSSVNVKAAATEYFKGEVLSTDPATGRVEVALIVEDVKGDKDDYDALKNYNTVAVSLNIASVDVTELLIADSEPKNIPMVSSNYANVHFVGWYNLARAFYFDNGENVTRYINDDTIEVPYNYVGTSAADKALFPGYEIKVGVWNDEADQQILYSTDVASKLFGLDLTVTYTGKTADGKPVTPVYSTANDKNADGKATVAPIAVTGNSLSATATLVASPDYKGKEAIGKYATLALGQFKAANTVLNLGGESKYEIVSGKVDAAVMIDPISKPWSYLDGTTAWTAEEGGFTKVEKNVKSGIENVVELFGDHNYGTTLKYSVKDENDVTRNAYAYVYAASKNVVVVYDITDDYGLLKYGTEKKTYTFTGEVYDKDEVAHTVALDIVLDAMPKGKTIDLGTFTLYGDVVHEQTIAVSPIAKALENIKVVDDSAVIEKLNWNYVGKEDVDGVTLNGEAAAAASLTLKTGPNKDDAKVTEDQSYVTVQPVAKYENNIVVTKTYEICGVEYTFVATVKTEAPAITLTPNEVYVANGVATVDGTVKLPINETKTSISTGKSTEYALNAINLRNYVKVQAPETVKTDGYRLRYTLVTPMYNEKEELLYGGIPSVQQEYTTVDAPLSLTWNVDTDALEYEVALVTKATVDADNDGSTADDDVVFGKFNVKLQIPSLVTFTAPNTVTAKVVNGVDATANIVGALTVVDKFNNNVYNPYAKDLEHIFSGYYATLDAKGVITSVASNEDSFFNVYKMNVVAAERKDVKVYLNNSEIAQSQVIFSYDEKTGEIVLSKENANITGDIKFEVPVTFTSVYGNEQKATAVVVFSQNAEEEDAPADAELPTPNGKQWAVAAHGNTWGMLFDFGVKYEGKFALPFSIKDMGGDPEALKADWIEQGYGPWDYAIVAETATSGTIYLGSLGRIDYTEPVFTYTEYNGTTMKINVSYLTEVENDVVEATVLTTPAVYYEQPTVDDGAL